MDITPTTDTTLRSPQWSRRSFLGSAAVVSAGAATLALGGTAHAAGPLVRTQVGASGTRPVLYTRQILSATPGEAFLVAGADFGSIPKVKALAVRCGRTPSTPPRESFDVRVVQVADAGVILQLPSRAPRAALALWVSDDSGRIWSKPLLLNASRAYYLDRQRAATGDTVTVIGEDISLGRTRPQVRLTSGGHSSDAAVKDFGPHHATFTVPRCSGSSATVRVSNGSGGDDGWSVPLTLAIGAAPRPGTVLDARTFGVDPTGATDSSAALQNLFNVAAGAPTGAIVQLPAGTLNITTKLTVPASSGPVVIRGAGIGRTTIRMDDSAVFYPDMPRNSPIDMWGTTADDQYSMIYCAAGDLGVSVEALTFDANDRRISALAFDGRNHSAVRKVRVENPSYPAQMYLYVGTHSVFAQNIADLVVQDCDFHAGGGVYLIGVKDVVVERSTFRLVFPRDPADPANPQHQADNSGIKIWGSRRITVRDNTFKRGSTQWYYARAFQTGGFKLPAQTAGAADAGGSEDVLCTRNLILDAGQPAGNCGESMVGDQFNTLQGGRVFLTVAAATSTTLSVADPAAFAVDDIRKDAIGGTVLLSSGRGTGQLRRVIANTGDTLTLDAPWDVVPTAGATFVLTVLHVKEIYHANTIRRSPKYLGNYGPSALCTLSDNNFSTVGAVIAEPAGYDFSGFLFTGIVTGEGPAGLIDATWYSRIIDNRAERGTVSLVWDVWANPISPEYPQAAIMRGNVLARNRSTGVSVAAQLGTGYAFTPQPDVFGDLNLCIDNTTDSGVNTKVDSVWKRTVYQGPAGGLQDTGKDTVIV